MQFDECGGVFLGRINAIAPVPVALVPAKELHVGFFQYQASGASACCIGSGAAEAARSFLQTTF
jgi:hypothetical protein